MPAKLRPSAQETMKNRVGAASAKQRALTVLKRKKMYEQQLMQLEGLQSNVDQARRGGGRRSRAG